MLLNISAFHRDGPQMAEFCRWMQVTSGAWIFLSVFIYILESHIIIVHRQLKDFLCISGPPAGPKSRVSDTGNPNIVKKNSGSQLTTFFRSHGICISLEDLCYHHRSQLRVFSEITLNSSRKHSFELFPEHWECVFRK